ncbi:unnamed protein product [Camellia sinensis]
MMRDITMTISLISADLVTPRTRAIAFCLVNEQVDGVKEYAMKMESVSILWKRQTLSLIHWSMRDLCQVLVLAQMQLLLLSL